MEEIVFLLKNGGSVNKINELIASHTSLNLKSQELGDESANLIGEVLSLNNNIENINLEYNNIGPVGATSICTALKRGNNQITNINFGFNNLGNKGTKLLSDFVKTSETLTTIGLARNKIGVNGARALGEALKVNQSVVNIYLGGNKIGVEGVLAISEAIQSNQTIKNIDLWDNNIGIEGALAFSESLKLNQTLTHINLERNEIGDEGVAAICNALSVNHSILNIDFSRNQISVSGAEAISKMLKHNQTLLFLNVSNNKVGDEGIKAISESLKLNHTISNINFKSNKISSKGTKFFSEALKINETITDINLGSNVIGVKGAKYLSVALKLNQTIQNIDISRNRIGNLGLLDISEALKSNFNIVSVKFRNNQINDEGLLSIIELLKCNGTLKSINLEDNNISKDAAKTLFSALKLNQSVQIIGFNDFNYTMPIDNAALMLAIENGQCTFAATGQVPEKNLKWWACTTCDSLGKGQVVCICCRAKCHPGHTGYEVAVADSSAIAAYCACGAGEISSVLCSCLANESKSVWYNLNATRATAESSLHGAPIGSFLVRRSSKSDCLALTVKEQSKTAHYMIRSTDTGWQANIGDPQNSFPTVFMLLRSISSFIKFPPDEPAVVEENLNNYSWFDKCATRESATSLLENASKGSFIVRPSSKPGCLALSVKENSRVIHAVVSKIETGWSVVLGESVSKVYPTVFDLMKSLHPFVNMDLETTSLVQEIAGDRESSRKSSLDRGSSRKSSFDWDSRRRSSFQDDDGTLLVSWDSLFDCSLDSVDLDQFCKRIKKYAMIAFHVVKSECRQTTIPPFEQLLAKLIHDINAVPDDKIERDEFDAFVSAATSNGDFMDALCSSFRAMCLATDVDDTGSSVSVGRSLSGDIEGVDFWYFGNDFLNEPGVWTEKRISSLAPTFRERFVVDGAGKIVDPKSFVKLEHTLNYLDRESVGFASCVTRARAIDNHWLRSGFLNYYELFKDSVYPTPPGSAFNEWCQRDGRDEDQDLLQWRKEIGDDLKLRRDEFRSAYNVPRGRNLGVSQTIAVHGTTAEIADLIASGGLKKQYRPKEKKDFFGTGVYTTNSLLYALYYSYVGAKHELMTKKGLSRHQAHQQALDRSFVVVVCYIQWRQAFPCVEDPTFDHSHGLSSSSSSSSSGGSNVRQRSLKPGFDMHHTLVSPQAEPGQPWIPQKFVNRGVPVAAEYCIDRLPEDLDVEQVLPMYIVEFDISSVRDAIELIMARAKHTEQQQRPVLGNQLGSGEYGHIPLLTGVELCLGRDFKKNSVTFASETNRPLLQTTKTTKTSSSSPAAAAAPATMGIPDLVTALPYFYKSVTLAMAELMLVGKPQGTFLVRPSEQLNVNAFCFSFVDRSDSCVGHWRVFYRRRQTVEFSLDYECWLRSFAKVLDALHLTDQLGLKNAKLPFAEDDAVSPLQTASLSSSGVYASSPKLLQIARKRLGALDSSTLPLPPQNTSISSQPSSSGLTNSDPDSFPPLPDTPK